MKKNTYTLNTLLAVVLGVILLITVIVRAFAPRIILFELDIPNLVLISLVTLLLDHYLAPGADRCYICIPVFSAITFAALSFAAYLGIEGALKNGITGCIVFTATTWLFTSMTDRLSSGPAAKAAPFASALGLYLAAQCMMGLF